MFCDRFKALRKERGFSQTKVATDFNVAQSTIASWELGTRSPVMEMIPHIAEYFGVSVDYLLDISDNPMPTNEIESDAFTTTVPAIAAMGREMEKMTPSQQEQLLAVGKALFKEYFKKDGD